MYGVQQSAWHGACCFACKSEFLQHLFPFVFPVITSVNKQYLCVGAGVWGTGASTGADANGRTVGMMDSDGHVKTAKVPCARIHDMHVHIQNKK